MEEECKMVAVLVMLLAFMGLGAQAYNGPDIIMSTFRLNEDLRVGEYAFTINATGNGPLTYSITGENAKYFNVNQHTGEVTVKQEMDRETSETISIMVEVSDTTATVAKLVVIILNDANDNAPLFKPFSYAENVPENTPLNALLFTVTATDLDFGLAKSVVYTIDSVIPSAGMELFAVSRTNGEVRLQGQLNATSKSNFYQIKFNASDEGGYLYGEFITQSSVAYAAITVIDVPDLNPQFINLPYLCTVNENTTVGTSVFKAEAIDPDTGINDKIIYTIQAASEPDLFLMNENTGVITTKNIFDREQYLEKNAVVTLSLLASETKPNVHGELASTSTDMNITIGDVNDNKPEFFDCMAGSCVLATSFSGNINENAPSGEFVKGMDIKVEDVDAEPNARFSLQLAGPDKDAFTVVTSSGSLKAKVEIRVRNSKDLDYEVKKTMTVEVVAIDKGNENLRSTATVTIQINDINDNYPTFKKETYNLKVEEHRHQGYIIANITATDLDAADADNITYRLLPDTVRKYIDVNPKTGSIEVMNQTMLDREVVPSITATLEATDSDGKSGRTILVFTLLDINDNAPQISRKSITDFMVEGPDGQLSVPIQATDADEEETVNNRIQYSILKSDYSDNFTINKDTGLLQNKGLIDREAIDPLLNGKIVLNVTATDMGVPARSAEVVVIVTVEDINDNKPVFRSAFYAFYVKESIMGGFVGLVFADDADQTTPNNRISFRITDGSLGNFIVTTSAEERGSGYIGNISVDPDVELDYEKGKKSYSLTIEATDMGQRRDFALAEVIVLDVNDERPVLSGDFTLHVPENTTNLGEVGKIEAEDPDSNSSLIYELLSTQCQCNGTLGPCAEDWFTVASTGAIIVNKEFVIDYEKCDKVVLETQVVDVFTEKGDNHSLPGYMTIIIDDINDNAPIFIEPEGVFVVLSENAQKDTTVANVFATDRDSGNNKVITFTVLSVSFVSTNNENKTMGKLFKVQTKPEEDFYKGEISCIGTLDSNLKGKYLITVEAKDGGGLTTTSQTEVFTIDKSYRVGLRFETSVVEVTANLVEIKSALEGATKSVVHILEIAAESKEQRVHSQTAKATLHKLATESSRESATEITVLGAYFVYSNGTALGSNTVEKMLQDDPYSAGILRKYGLTYIVSGVTEVKEVNPVFLILIGVVAGLVIVLVVMITSFVCTQRSYRRKLKAAKAMSTSAMKTENHTSGAIVPGTNKYNMEGANPMLNLNIDTTVDLGFDEDLAFDPPSSDKVSLNSLDCDINGIMEDKDSIKMMTIQEEVEEPTYDHCVEPLSAALAQQHKNKELNDKFAFTNPSLDTTDL